MSRVSQKSPLSPSVSGGSGINLGKDGGGGVDMGRKTEPSVTSGGIGVTTEVTNIGGVSVTAGASVELSPIDLGVNYDPSENSVSVAAGGEVPGGLLGASGGVTIDLDTGEITGGQVGAEGLGLGVNISASKDGGLGLGITVQIPFTPIEFELGFGFPPRGKKPTPTPTPTPTNWEKPNLPIGDPSKFCTVIVAIHRLTYWVINGIETEHYEYRSSGSYSPKTPTSSEKLNVEEKWIKENGKPSNITHTYPNTAGIWGGSPLARFNRIINTSSPYNGIYQPDGIIWGLNGREIEVYAFLNNHIYIDERQGPPSSPSQFYIKQTYEIIYSSCSVPDINDLPPSFPSVPPPPFPNPPPRKNNKMDQCCQDNLKFLRAIYKGLGIAKFPGKLPATIIQEISQEGEEAAEPPQVPIEDFVDLLDWQFKRDDERWGQWEIQIDIKDSDITKEGDQKKSIKFPNLAESLAEFEGQLLSIMANVDALVAMQVKNLAESGMARQEAIKGYLASKAIIKYMAFKSTEIDVPVPMTFTAGAETISALLEESEGHIKGTDYVEKETLRDVNLDLLQAAAIIRAVHWQKIDSKRDTKSQLLSILKGSVDLATSIAKPQNPNGDSGEKAFDPENDFEDFIDSVEDGFRNTAGITDIQNPYGKAPSRRPRIRQIGDNVSQAGGSD